MSKLVDVTDDVSISSTQDVNIRDIMSSKSVLVDLTNGKRRYTFKGSCTGNDVRLLLTSFTREYKLYMQEMRRRGERRI